MGASWVFLHFPITIREIRSDCLKFLYLCSWQVSYASKQHPLSGMVCCGSIEPFLCIVIYKIWDVFLFDSHNFCFIILCEPVSYATVISQSLIIQIWPFPVEKKKMGGKNKFYSCPLHTVVEILIVNKRRHTDILV